VSKQYLIASVMVAAALADASFAKAAPSREVDYVLVPPAPRSDSRAAKVIYLNRCVGGCDVNIGSNRAQTNSSTIPKAPGRLAPFMHGDPAWQEVLSCVRQLYAPYAIEITDVEPADSTAHVEVMVAGSPTELNLETNTLGIAPLTNDCSPQKNVLAFAFANAHAPTAMVDLCATAAHEAGHVFGLDHAFTCRDPMTYLSGCGQKFFLNLELPCGEFDGARPCRCGDSQNSHKKLSRAIDVGTIPAAPMINLVVPAPGAVVSTGFVITAKVEEKRWVSRVELWINGRLWRTAAPGPSIAPVVFYPPADLPGGVLNIEVRAYNDLGVRGTATVTVTKGEACTSPATCLAGQSCQNGGCYFPAATGEIGDSCERNDQCAEQLCQKSVAGEGSVCSSICVIGAGDQCQAGPQPQQCIASNDGFGVCLAPVEDSGGCCQSQNDAGTLWSISGLTAVVGLMMRRRRKRPY
jgi:Metallo-peptidase family M12B Reprolysin-like